jgi:YidC/Oxa1 family membrane protein insertase
MADPSQDNRQDQSNQPQGLSMERRLLVAFVLMGLILFLTPYLYKSSAPPPKSVQPAPPQPPAQQVEQAKPPAPALAPASVAQVSASEEETFIVETELYRVVLSNRGAVVRSWVLKKYKDSSGKPLELVNAAGAAKTGFPFSFEFPGGKAPAELNNVLFSAQPAADGLGVKYEYSDGRVVARKSFLFQRNRYLADLTSYVVADGKLVPHVLTWRGGFGDAGGFNHPGALHSLSFDVAANKLVVQQAKAAKNGPVSSFGAYSFAGIEDSYFTAVVLPVGQSPFEIRTFSDQVAPTPGAAEVPFLGVGVGGSGENRFSLFVGPKDIDILRGVNPKLEQVVDFGWFSIIAKPLFLALNWVNNRWVHNYGWSIVVVTIIINFLLLPLKFSSLKSMKKMQLLQPQIKAINDKYKGIGLRDPRKAEQNQEVMELYKRHGVNPMGGCMPMILQIPFFFAYYKVLSVAIEMRGAQWLWVTDLSQPEHWLTINGFDIRILPIVMIVTQFIMQKMTPSTAADPSQQKMMLMMPLILGFMFYGISSGLVLYWLTGNVVGIAQQWFFNRTAAPLPAVAPVPAPKAKSRKAIRK